MKYTAGSGKLYRNKTTNKIIGRTIIVVAPDTIDNYEEIALHDSSAFQARIEALKKRVGKNTVK